MVLLFAVNVGNVNAQAKLAGADVSAQVKLVNFYPNPATANINFEFVKGYNNTHRLEVYNFMGKKVYEVVKMPQRLSILLDDFYRGIYIFQLRNKNGVILQSGKFQVVK